MEQGCRQGGRWGGGGGGGGCAEANSASPVVVEELCIQPKVYKRQTIVTN